MNKCILVTAFRPENVPSKNRKVERQNENNMLYHFKCKYGKDHVGDTVLRLRTRISLLIHQKTDPRIYEHLISCKFSKWNTKNNFGNVKSLLNIKYDRISST